MAISRTLSGYHKGCGGAVYKETLSNSLGSHYKCDACGSSSATGLLNIQRDVASTIDEVRLTHPTGDLALVDTEYRDAFSDTIAAINAGTYPQTNFLDAVVSGNGNSLNLNGYLATIPTYVAIVDSLGATMAANEEFLAGQLAAVTPNTDGTVAPPDTDASVATYLYDAAFDYDELIDSSSGVFAAATSYRYGDSGENTVTRQFIHTTADTSEDSVLVSADFAPGFTFNDVYIVAYSLNQDATVGDLIMDDWTRGTTALFQVSANGGSTYFNAKLIDSTLANLAENVQVTNYRFATPGNTFKWKLTFQSGSRPQGILKIFATLRAKPTTISTDYEYERYAVS